MRQLDTVLFDYDGTLMDTTEMILTSWKITLDTYGCTGVTDEDVMQSLGEPLMDTLARFVPDVPPEESVKVYRAFQEEHFLDYIHLFPGVEEMLQKIRDMGCPTALVTSRLRSTTMQGVEAFDLAKYFDVIITASDVTVHKPDPAPVFIALEKIGSSPERALMLGDTLYDIRCARNAGVVPVLVSWSEALRGATMESLGDDAPDYLIGHPSELTGILEG